MSDEPVKTDAEPAHFAPSGPRDVPTSADAAKPTVETDRQVADEKVKEAAQSATALDPHTELLAVLREYHTQFKAVNPALALRAQTALDKG